MYSARESRQPASSKLDPASSRSYHSITRDGLHRGEEAGKRAWQPKMGTLPVSLSFVARPRPRIARLVLFLLATALTSGALYFVFRGVDIAQLWGELGRHDMLLLSA